MLLIVGSLATLCLPSPTPPVKSEYQRHVDELRARLPSSDFTIVESPPFVVVGDESPKVVHRRAKNTVEWAVRMLKQSYFSKDPDEVIDVWLFKNRESYEYHVAKLWDTTPTTPFGYYSSYHKVLVMNISTGGGTLVHEIVHPFMESNFPECPDWFNEGLASLYEQCGERGGRIHGKTNWRLEGLQTAIASGKLQSFKKLTTRDFYGDDKGTNYAMARYLCYYLQQEGKLRSYYRTFRANVEHDPTGYKTLGKILGEPDMKAFQSRWEKYVLGLRYP